MCLFPEDSMPPQEEHYEWCRSYGEFRHLLRPQLADHDRVIILGCGNSSLPTDLVHICLPIRILTSLLIL